MSRKALNVIGLLTSLPVCPSVGAQVLCQFTPNYVLAQPLQSYAHRLAVGASFTYTLDDVKQWGAGADLAYRASRALVLGIGLAYCDPRFGFDPGLLIGSYATWSTVVSADSAWVLSGAVGASYVAIDLGPTTQRDVAVPVTVALHRARGRVGAYAGAMLQYNRSWTTVTTFRSRIDPAGLIGLEIRLSSTLALGGGYHFLWFTDARGNSGILDRAGVRLRYLR